MASEMERGRVETPADLDVVLVCPRCGAVEAVGAKLRTRLVIDQGDGGTTLSLRARSLKLAHACEQITMESLARDQGDT
jgi:hypothetical protein